MAQRFISVLPRNKRLVISGDQKRAIYDIACCERGDRNQQTKGGLYAEVRGCCIFPRLRRPDSTAIRANPKEQQRELNHRVTEGTEIPVSDPQVRCILDQERL